MEPRGKAGRARDGLRVEVRDSRTHALLSTLTERSKIGDDSTLEMLVPGPGGKPLAFEDDRAAWLKALPLALAQCSMVYAEVVDDRAKGCR